MLIKVNLKGFCWCSAIGSRFYMHHKASAFISFGSKMVGMRVVRL